MTNVSNALITKQSQFITWPTDAEVAEVKNSFYQRGSFPCVIGCVDGTHIRTVFYFLHEVHNRADTFLHEVNNSENSGIVEIDIIFSRFFGQG